MAVLVTTALIGIVAAVARNSSRQPATPEQVMPELSAHIDVALHKARFVEMRNGSVLWDLVADRAEYDRAGELVHLTGLTMTFDRSPASEPLTLTADRGQYAERSRRLALRGRIHVKTGTGASFDTDSIEYRADRSLLATDAPVSFRHQRLSLQATGMEFDVERQKGRFKSEVTAAVAGLGRVAR